VQKNNLSLGYSLIEIIVVISLISILGYFITLSFNVLNYEKIISKEDKINAIEQVIVSIKQRSLAKGKILTYLIEEELFQIDAFKNCKISNNEKRKVYFTPSGEISSFQFDCIIAKEHWTFYMSNSGKVGVHDKN